MDSAGQPRLLSAESPGENRVTLAGFPAVTTPLCVVKNMTPSGEVRCARMNKEWARRPRPP